MKIVSSSNSGNQNYIGVLMCDVMDVGVDVDGLQEFSLPVFGDMK